jgi:hypothetical protein
MKTLAVIAFALTLTVSAPALAKTSRGVAPGGVIGPNPGPVAVSYATPPTRLPKSFLGVMPGGVIGPNSGPTHVLVVDKKPPPRHPTITPLSWVSPPARLTPPPYGGAGA